MSDALQITGCIAASLAAAAAMLAPDRRLRAAGMLVALGLALVLVAGEGWDQLDSIRHRPAALGGAAVLGVVAIGGLAAAMRRWPLSLPLLLIAALPFRVPIQVSGDDANLLVPLYIVIAAGAVAYAVGALQGGDEPEERSRLRPLPVVLAGAVVLYAIQASYSLDAGFATRNVGFFLIPFGVLFALLAEQRWTPRLLGLCLAVVAGEAALFSLVGIGQHLTEEIFWNPSLERSNDFHYYFRANSLFWDPNIFGRYLAIPAVLIVAVALWTREPRRLAAVAGVLALLLLGLLTAYSQTSFISVLCGVTVLAALGLSLRWTIVGAPIAAVAVILVVFVAGGTSRSEDSAKEISSGRTTLIEGGWHLARSEPVIGHGSASFSRAFAEQEDITTQKTTISHNEPVTVAAEQGLVGLLVYAALILTAFWTLLAGIRRIAPGLGAPRDSIGDPADGGEPALNLARIALVSALVALLVHTIGYGGYLTDPLTWTLLAIGASLASRPAASEPSAR